MKSKVLIIEDEAGIVDNIIYALKTDGYNTQWCATGKDGLKVIEKENISIIILDIGLPDINGFETDLKSVVYSSYRYFIPENWG